MEQVVTDKSAPVLKEVVAEVCDRYDRRAHAAYEERYDHEARRKSEWSHLNEAIEEIEHGRAKRLWSRSPHSSPHPTRKAAEASVTEKHQSAVLEAFEVACDEVVGRGELGARLRKHREQVQRAGGRPAGSRPRRTLAVHDRLDHGPRHAPARPGRIEQGRGAPSPESAGRPLRGAGPNPSASALPAGER